MPNPRKKIHQYQFKLKQSSKHKRYCWVPVHTLISFTQFLTQHWDSPVESYEWPSALSWSWKHICSYSAWAISCLWYNSLLPGCSQYLLNRLQKVHNNAARFILLIFALCTGFQSMLESNTNFVLFVLVLSLLLVLSIFPIYSRFAHPLGDSNLLETSVRCAFHLSTLSHMVNALSLTPLQHSGAHFQKTLDFSQSVSSFRSALKTHLFPT